MAGSGGWSLNARTRWVLALAALQALVLAGGIIGTVGSGFVGFAALGAAWMFLGVRASRFVLGDRSFSDEARRIAARLRLAGGGDDPPPSEVVAAMGELRVHDRLALAASAGVALALSTGSIAVWWPGSGPWWFGLAALVVVGSLLRLWAWRGPWARARALIEAYWPERGRP